MFGLLPFSVGPWELVLVLVIVLIIVGPGKLPSVGKSIGKAINEFRKSRNETDENDSIEEKAEVTKR
ncbi:MAG: twin-arginine translocase TatA/TatE family subunit [Syntrophomonadaceae bacterium]|nr:twin-arginine translocase TatA/TatE family subunit [Syntrophomonadaceae bacterium]